MALRIAINGFGRIGRNILRGIHERGLEKDIEIIAINDLGPVEISAHLAEFDSVHGRFNKNIIVEGDSFSIDGKSIKVFSERDPKKLPWGALDIDIVVESTGVMRTREKAQWHIDAGAKKVLISAPASDDVPMIVFGCNEHIVTKDDEIISNASCTTNCLAPMLEVLDDAFGVDSGLMTTVHSYTNDQLLLDTYHKDPRRARAAALNMIPTSTGATSAVTKILPKFSGKLMGYAIRVPTPNVSLVDLTLVLNQKATKESITQAFDKAAAGRFKGIIQVEHKPLVSSDFNHNAASCVIDSPSTLVSADGMHIKVCAWYDNEWGYANRMIDAINYIGGLV